MNRHILVVFVTLATGTTSASIRAEQPGNPTGAAGRIVQAIAAMGGEERLRAVKTISLTSMGHTWALEQSERPEGPWLSNFQPSMLLDVRAAVEREGLTGIEKVFGMHLVPTPWSDVLDAIRKAMSWRDARPSGRACGEPLDVDAFVRTEPGRIAAGGVLAHA